jgi:hypothetical protein
MKISKAINFCLQYQKSNSKTNTVCNYEFVLGKFDAAFPERELESITTEEVIAFLAELSDGRKQNTKRGLPKAQQWTIIDEDTIDEAIFRTVHVRNRLMLDSWPEAA